MPKIDYTKTKMVCDLKSFWHECENRDKTRYTFRQVADAIGVHQSSVANLYNGKTTRFDEHIPGRIAAFFGVKNGEPIPFMRLIVVYSDSKTD